MGMQSRRLFATATGCALALVLALMATTAAGQTVTRPSAFIPTNRARQPVPYEVAEVVRDKEISTRPRWSLVIPAGSLAFAALASGIGTTIAAADVEATRDEQLDQLMGVLSISPCVAGTPLVQQCAELADAAQRAALLKPIGAGLLVGGAALAVVTLVFASAAQERDDETDRPGDGAAPRAAKVMLLPSLGGVNLVGQF